MARKSTRSKHSPEVYRLEARTRAIVSINKVMVLALCLAVGFVVSAAALPQMRKLEDLQSRLDDVRNLESEIITRRDDCAELYAALKNDPECLEQYARDRLDYYRPGERVLRIEREE